MDRVSTFPTFPELFTERLVLRELTAADAPWYLEHFSRPEIVTGTGFPAPSDLAAAASELRAYVLDLFKARSGFRWGIATREDPRLVGSAGLYKWVDGPAPRRNSGMTSSRVRGVGDTCTRRSSRSWSSRSGG